MATLFKLPMLGQTMQEGTILKWHKAEGDAIVRKHSWGQRKPPPLWTQSLCPRRPSCVPTHTLAKRLWIGAYDALTMAHL